MSKYFFYVILPILFGTLPYILLRKDAAIFIVTVKEKFKKYFEIEINHHQVFRLESNWDWVIYNLPDAFWAFSLTSFIILSTRTDSQKIQSLYLLIIIVMMLILEITVGTFDWLDLLAMFSGFITSILILRISLRN